MNFFICVSNAARNLFIKSFLCQKGNYSSYCIHVRECINQAISLFEEEVDHDMIFQFDIVRDYGRFWRVLIDMDPSLKTYIKNSAVNAFMEQKKKGALTKLEWQKERGVLMVKSRNLNQLQSMFNKFIDDLLKQI